MAPRAPSTDLVVDVVTSDIERFWRTMDEAMGKDTVARTSLIRDLYIRAGSAGLCDWAGSRLSTPEAAASRLEHITRERRQFYGSIRATTLALTESSMSEAIRATLRPLRVVCPDALFPDVYLLMGALVSRGTISRSGILIGVDLCARDAGTSLDELTAWERATLAAPRAIPHIVVHEWVHAQQPRARHPATLLHQALREGAAEFVARMVTGAEGLDEEWYSYGQAHERTLWREFRRAMHGTDVRAWLYQGATWNGRPPDLGYFFGYRICESLYRHSPDQQHTFRRLLTWDGAERLLHDSGYPDR